MRIELVRSDEGEAESFFFLITGSPKDLDFILRVAGQCPGMLALY